MENRTFITVNDHQRLTGLIDFASLNIKMPEIVNQLRDKMATARKLPPERISNTVVTMNSRVLLKELSTRKQIEITITYPKDANNKERKVSVFSAIGVSLLGRQVGDIVSWKVPGGIGRFKIVEITYQPEAVGDYYL
jgi:regulator of nucleoside diphosphate kinase